MGSTVINAYTYPETLDVPVVPADLRRALDQVAQGGMMRFGSAAERTAAFATLGQTPTLGMTSFRPNRFEFWTGLDWAPMPGQILQRGRRPTASTSTTTEIGVLLINDEPIIKGQALKIYTSALTPDSSVANEVMAARIRYTTDGSTPTTASAILPGSMAQVRQPDANNGESVNINTIYAPANNETLSLLLTVFRVTALGNVVLFADGNFSSDLVLESGGFDPGDTGVDI